MGQFETGPVLWTNMLTHLVPSRAEAAVGNGPLGAAMSLLCIACRATMVQNCGLI